MHWRYSMSSSPSSRRAGGSPVTPDPALPRMTYHEALAALRRALVFGINPSLDGITQLAEALGRPQDSFASVQITGTNGKSSTTRITAALLEAEGLRTGLYTSPELERYPERIEVGTAVVSDRDFALALSAALEAGGRLRGASSLGTDAGFTEFELLTAAALWLFRERGVELAVLEVGLGGRWDATSVVAPSVAVIIGVGLDHTGILGDTLGAIAAEKAAIIRPATAPILGPGTVGVEAVFLERAESLGTHARAVREFGAPSPVEEALTVRYRLVSRPDSPGGVTTVDVHGIHSEYPSLALTGPAYQAANIATAVAAAEAALGRALDPDRARTALAALRIPGRFELMRREPDVVIDASHNPQAAAVLADAIRDAWPDPAKRPLVLLGIFADKDARGIIEALAPVAGAFAVTQSSSPRAMPADELAALVADVTGTPPTAVNSVLAEGLHAALATPARAVVVTGSITTAGEARALLRDTSATSAP